MPEQGNDEFETEFAALKSIIDSLKPLRPEIQTKVLRYVVETFGLTQQFSDNVGKHTTDDAFGGSVSESRQPVGPSVGGAEIHIKQVVEQKKPRSANEMAALVAYYLAEIVQGDKRKKAINSADLTTYFKIGGFALPERIDMTLPNATNAGYFESVGAGEYKLNAIGHNLVAHSMPRGSETKPVKARRSSKKATRK